LRLKGTIEGTSAFFKNNVMTEIACEDDDTCNVDQRSFKAYLSRWMAYTATVAPWTREMIDPWLQASAKAAAAQCINGANGISCGLRWFNSDTNDGSSGVGEQMAAMEIVQSLLYPTVTGPATKRNGGISVSDPGAGLETTNTHIAFNTITVSDKAGACMATVILVVGTVYGALWMQFEGA
jgi:mannan endo-1,6-alpha-mannosidase